jgi:hypothetical protein
MVFVIAFATYRHIHGEIQRYFNDPLQATGGVISLPAFSSITANPK